MMRSHDMTKTLYDAKGRVRKWRLLRSTPWLSQWTGSSWAFLLTETPSLPCHQYIIIVSFLIFWNGASSSDTEQSNFIQERDFILLSLMFFFFLWGRTTVPSPHWSYNGDQFRVVLSAYISGVLYNVMSGPLTLLRMCYGLQWDDLRWRGILIGPLGSNVRATGLAGGITGRETSWFMIGANRHRP